MAPRELEIHGIPLSWDDADASFRYAGYDAAVFWIDSSVRELFVAIRELAPGAYERIVAAWGRRTGIPVAEQLRQLGVLSSASDTRDRLLAVYRAAGWGDAEILQVNEATRDVRMRVRSSWEVRLKRAIGDEGRCAFLPQHWAGVWSGYFDAPCIAEELRCQSQGADACEFRVYPAPHKNLDLDVRAFFTAEARRELEAARGRARELDAVLAQLVDAVVVVGLDGQLIVVNPAARSLLGLGAGTTLAEFGRTAELLGADGEVLPPERWPVARALAGESVQGETLRLRRAGAGELALSASAVPLVGDDGARWGAAVVLREVTAEFELRQRLMVERESAERRARESTELAAAAGDIVGALDLPAQLARIAERACRMARADYAAVATVAEDGETTWRTVVGGRGDAWRAMVFPPGRGTAGRVIAADAPIVIERFGDDPAFPPDEFPAQVAEGMRSAAAVPLRAGGRPFGVVIAGWRGRDEVDPDVIPTLQVLADLAASAIERSRLIDDAHAQARGLAAANAALEAQRTRLARELERARQLVRLTGLVAETLDQGRIAEAVLDGLVAGGIDVDTASLYLYDAGRRRIVGRRRRELHEREPWTSRMRAVEGDYAEVPVDDIPLLARLVDGRETIVLPDTTVGDALLPEAYTGHFGVGSVLAVPLGASGEVVGALFASTLGRPRAYEPADVAFIETLGGTAAAAIYNARGYAAIADQREALEQANAELEAVQDELQEQASATVLANQRLEERNRALDVRVAELDAVLDQMADGVVICDAGGTIVRANPAAERMHGQSLVTAREGEWAARFRLLRLDGTPYPDDELPLARALRRVETADGAEWLVERPDGARARLFGSASPLRDADGGVAGAVLVMRDVTERARLVDQVQQATAMKERFFASMSHELRTPINAILGYSGLIAEGLGGELPEKATQMVGRIRQSGSHLLELVNDVLDISKLEAGKIEVRPEAVDLAALVRDTLTSVEPQAQAKGLSLALRLPDALPAHTDPARVRQILLNLASNAVKFTDTGTVTIELVADGALVRLAVEDSGVGIAAADHDRVFAEFVQVGKGRPDGTGLGLAISRRLARLLSGDLSLESEPGRGSRFTLTIPTDLEVARDAAGRR